MSGDFVTVFSRLQMNSEKNKRIFLELLQNLKKCGMIYKVPPEFFVPEGKFTERM